MSDRDSAADVGVDLLLAFGFLTRLPVPARAWSGGTGRLARAVWAFPLVGLAVGLLGGGVWLAADLAGLPALLCAAIAVLATVMATGGLHEDGLADVADGTGGATPERRLEIMRDSRLGSYGALAILFAVLLRIIVYGGLGDAATAVALFVGAEAFSRGLLPQAMLRLPPARADGLGRGAGKPREGPANAAVLLGGAIALIALGPLAGIAAMAAGGLAAWVVAAWAKRRLGGQTGDVLGAMQLCGSVCFLIGALLGGVQ